MMLAGVTIRNLSLEDIHEVFELERQTPGAPHWQRSDYERLFAKDDTLSGCGVVARVSDSVIGFAIARVLRIGGHSEAELETIVVQAESRRNGVAGQLVSALLARLALNAVEELRLEVRSSNHAAVSLYKSRGFYQVGVRKRYYRTPDEDAILMKLCLPLDLSR